jgi:hypothetical protein
MQNETRCCFWKGAEVRSSVNVLGNAEFMGATKHAASFSNLFFQLPPPIQNNSQYRLFSTPQSAAVSYDLGDKPHDIDNVM